MAWDSMEKAMLNWRGVITVYWEVLFWGLSMALEVLSSASLDCFEAESGLACLFVMNLIFLRDEHVLCSLFRWFFVIGATYDGVALF